LYVEVFEAGAWCTLSAISVGFDGREGDSYKNEVFTLSFSGVESRQVMTERDEKRMQTLEQRVEKLERARCGLDARVYRLELTMTSVGAMCISLLSACLEDSRFAEQKPVLEQLRARFREVFGVVGGGR
jgi:hypothetical protein